VWHAHNGFLDLTLELGLIGLLIFLVGYLVAFGRAVRTLRNDSQAAGFWQVAVLVFLLAANVGESMLLEYNGVWWVLYLAIVFAPTPPPSRAQPSQGQGTPRGLKGVLVTRHANGVRPPARSRALPSIRWRT
jgi:O-antigen ligase